MFKLNSSNKIIFLGIFLVIIQTFFGASFDTTTKFLGSSKNFLWYHYYALGLGLPMILFIFFFVISKSVKKNLLFKNKKDYFLPLFRGFTFIPILITIYYSLKQIPLNIFTPIIMTTPFFILIWSSVLQKEIISLKYWVILIIGFVGTILIAKPIMFQTNVFVYLIFLVAAYNALTSVVVSKFSKNATALGYSFYNLLPLTLFCVILSVIYPVKLMKEEFSIIFIGGFLLFFASLLFNFIFHVSGKYTRFISPFFFLQLVWASILGNYFFNENLDKLSILGMAFIVVSGSLTIFYSNK